MLQHFPPPAPDARVMRRVDEAAVDEAAVNEAAAHSAPASESVGELPDEVLRKIWSIRWRAGAAEVIQRAVRRAIRLAGGLPLDLPSLLYPDYSDTQPSWYETGLGSSSEYLMKYCAKMPLMVDARRRCAAQRTCVRVY